MHFVNRLDPKTFALLERAPGLKVYNVPSAGHYTFPMRCDTPPFDNLDLRLALKYAIDRDDMVDKILRGYGKPGNDHPVPEFDPFYNADLPLREYDPDKAKFHLGKSGHSGPVTLHIADAAFTGAVDAATLYQQHAQAAGIDLALQRVPEDGYWSETWMQKPFCGSCSACSCCSSPRCTCRSATTWPRVYTGERHWRVERALYRVVRVDPDSEQRWTGYAAALLAFSFLSVVLLYLLQRLQALLPLSLGRGPVEPGIAFNTAVSFVTNTNWQSYVPETVMGHLVQMAGLTVQNFVSAAVGMAVAVALVRGFARARTDRIGNFWVDLTRGVTRVLLPISFVAAIVLVALGVTMSLRAGVDVTGVDGGVVDDRPGARPPPRRRSRSWAPTAAGIFNANSAHPFENPNALDQPAGDLPAAGHPGLPDPRVRGHGARHPAGPRRCSR